MYDLYFADESLDGTAVPYLEGDYFPGEAENVIKEIEDGKSKKGGAFGKKNKKKQSKAKGKNGTRSMDDEALIARGILDPPKGFEEGGRDELMVIMGETIEPMKESFIVAFLNWSGAKEEDKVVPEEILRDRREVAKKPSQVISLKRDADDKIRGDGSKVPLDDKGRLIKVADDDDEDMDCEFFNNRQSFLNLCRGNHYQLDELRRAKHTSLMVLWHLHNRDAPKFVQQCASCLREILSGTRYHCETCPEFDLCGECYKSPTANRGACTHKLRPLSAESENKEDEMGGGSGLTEEQRKERQRNIQLHIQLIEHASRCNSPQCTSSNCAKMKSYLQHGRSCKVSCHSFYFAASETCISRFSLLLLICF
jgi:E1A/CREB-binding protein